MSDPSKAQEDAFVRSVLIADAYSKRKPIEVEGVTIDLACDLDPDVWMPVFHLGTYHHPAVDLGPEIAFPWAPPSWRDFISKACDLVEVRDGGIVTVHALRAARFRDSADDFVDDDLVRLAYLQVIDADGTVHPVSRPLVLLALSGISQFIRINDYNGSYYGLIKRLEDATMIDDIEDLVEGETIDLPDIPESVNINYKLAFLALVEASKKYDEKAYVAFGYMMGRVETEERLLRYAVRGRAAATHQAKASGGRHDKAYARSEPLRNAARRIIAENKNISLNACARAVADEMAKDEEWKMSLDPKGIVERIRELFERRENGREYRPKQFS